MTNLLRSECRQLRIQFNKVHALLKVAQARNLPIVVVGAERDADWNTFCDLLENDFDPITIRLGNLSRAEVEALIVLLERHECLGLPKECSDDQRVDAFIQIHRQINCSCLI